MKLNVFIVEGEWNMLIHRITCLYLCICKVWRDNIVCIRHVQRMKLSVNSLIMWKSEVGTRNFFLSPQSQFRNLKGALPQSQFRNFLRNVAPQPQLRNSAIAIFSEIRNFRSSTWELHFRNFRNIFRRGVAGITYFFYHQAVFVFERF